MGYFALMGIIIFVTMFYSGYQTFKNGHLKNEMKELEKSYLLLKAENDKLKTENAKLLKDA